ncbi:MAG: SCO family protein, partial [Pseudobdellovibrionaceae bacterium]
MKNFKIIFLSLVIFSFGLIPLLHANEDSLSDSLFISQSQWKNQESQSVKLKDLQAVNVILTMTYTGCQYSCPMTLKKLEKIEKDLLKKGVQNYRFVVISFDPKFDTPKALKDYMKKMK